MADQNKELVRKFMDECWNSGRVTSLEQLVTSQVKTHDPVFPGLAAGVDGLRQHITNSRKGFPDLHFTIEDIIGEGKEVVIHWTAKGTHRGDFLGMPPTNRSATVSGTSIFRIEGGKINECWVDWNLLSLTEQLGVAAKTATVQAHR